jgi:hypothetical protein
MKTTVILTLLSLSFAALASEKIVECRVAGPVAEAKLQVKFQGGKLVTWSDNELIAPSSHQAFSNLLSPIETDDGPSYEWTRIFKTVNGFQIIEAGTTADAVKLGIKINPAKSGNKGKGFYEYKDLGSGNGNSLDPLTCIVK